MRPFLPGMDEKDVSVTLSNGVLTLKGEKKSEREEKSHGRDDPGSLASLGKRGRKARFRSFAAARRRVPCLLRSIGAATVS